MAVRESTCISVARISVAELVCHASSSHPTPFSCKDSWLSIPCLNECLKNLSASCLEPRTSMPMASVLIAQLECFLWPFDLPTIVICLEHWSVGLTLYCPAGKATVSVPSFTALVTSPGNKTYVSSPQHTGATVAGGLVVLVVNSLVVVGGFWTGVVGSELGSLQALSSFRSEEQYFFGFVSHCNRAHPTTLFCLFLSLKTATMEYRP